MESKPERQQPDQNPEQGKDPRIPKVIDELTQMARYLKDPRLLTLKSDPEKPPILIQYISKDRLKHVSLSADNFQRPDYALSNLPKQLQEYERNIPVTVELIEPNVAPSYIHVWITLDKNNPTIFQLVHEDGEPKSILGKISGEEKALKRKDLLPYILEAVSGEKYVTTKYYTDPEPWDEWNAKNTT